MYLFTCNSNYVERRKKNNEAAKRSRDARRAKEDEVSIRAAFLEQENIQLKWDVTKLRAEVAKMGFLSPRDPKNFTNKAKKSFPTHKLCTSGMILSATLNPQKKVQKISIEKRTIALSFIFYPRL